MEKETTFQNPPFNISERNYIDITSEYFLILSQILHAELTATNPLFYCSEHHAMVTRAAKKYHLQEPCELYKRGRLLSTSSII